MAFAFVSALAAGGTLVAVAPLWALGMGDSLTNVDVALFLVAAPLSVLTGGFVLRGALALGLSVALPMMLRREGETVRFRPAGSLRHARGMVFAASDLVGVRFAPWQHGLRRAVMVHRVGPAFYLCDASPASLGALRADLDARWSGGRSELCTPDPAVGEVRRAGRDVRGT